MSSPRREYNIFQPIPRPYAVVDTERQRFHLVNGHNIKQEVAFEDGLIHRGAVGFENKHLPNPPGVTMAQRFNNEFPLSYPRMKMRSSG